VRGSGDGADAAWVAVWVAVFAAGIALIPSTIAVQDRLAGWGRAILLATGILLVVVGIAGAAVALTRRQPAPHAAPAPPRPDVGGATTGVATDRVAMWWSLLRAPFGAVVRLSRTLMVGSRIEVTGQDSKPPAPPKPGSGE
jgi:hypothetical protein